MGMGILLFLRSYLQLIGYTKINITVCDYSILLFASNPLLLGCMYALKNVLPKMKCGIKKIKKSQLALKLIETKPKRRTLKKIKPTKNQQQSERNKNKLI